MLHPKFENTAQYCKISLELSNLALSEINTLVSRDKQTEIELLQGPPFSRYFLSLQYMFTSEICKLLEPSNPSSDRNISSIENAADILLIEAGDGFSETHLIVKREITELRESSIFKEIKSLRDQKFAHSDGSLEIHPLKLSVIFPDLIENSFVLLNSIYSVMNQILAHQNISLKSDVPHWDKRTSTFIKYHAVYKDFYFQNQQLASQQGYTL